MILASKFKIGDEVIITDPKDRRKGQSFVIGQINSAMDTNERYVYFAASGSFRSSGAFERKLALVDREIRLDY